MSRITEFRATNFMGIEVVKIEPDGNLTIIQGENGQGKSSLMQALWTLLASKAALRDIDRPVRDGEDRAILEGTVMGDDGEGLRITRTIRPDGDMKIKVTNLDGSMQYTSAETMLKKLFHSVSFDPLAFARMKPKEQVEFYLKAIDTEFDLGELNVERTDIFDQRTVVNRDLKTAQAALEAEPTPAEGIDPDAEEISAAEIMRERDDAQAVIDERRLAEVKLEEERAEIERANERLSTARLELTRAQQNLDESLTALKDAAKVKAALPAAPDLSLFADRIASVEDRNRQIRAGQKRRVLGETVTELEGKAAELTAAIEAIDARKREAIAAVPEIVESLSFDEEQMLFCDRPLAQASGSEQLIVSCRVGIALNPDVRVMTVQDGPLLDQRSMKMLEALADENDFQIWVERVGKGEVGITIEAGRVVDGISAPVLTPPSPYPEISEPIGLDDNTKAMLATGIPQIERGDEPMRFTPPANDGPIRNSIGVDGYSTDDNEEMRLRDEANDGPRMLYVGGSTTSFRCACGGNVFTELEPNVYSCNSCQQEYEGEGLKPVTPVDEPDVLDALIDAEDI